MVLSCYHMDDYGLKESLQPAVCMDMIDHSAVAALADGHQPMLDVLAHVFHLLSIKSVIPLKTAVLVYLSLIYGAIIPSSCWKGKVSD